MNTNAQTVIQPIHEEASLNKRTQLRGSALFVCQAIVDYLSVTERMPPSNGREPALLTLDQPGGNAFTAAMTCAILGFKPDVISGVGNDLAGRFIEDAVKNAGVYWHPRAMPCTPTSKVTSHPRGRSIVSPPDKEGHEPYIPELDIEGCRLVAFDGRNFDAALRYRDKALEHDVRRYMDVGRRRPGIEELVPFMTHPSVSRRYCEDMDRGVDDMLHELRKHSELAIVTLGDEGIRYVTRECGDIQRLPAIKPPGPVVDENGAGDNFNGARMFADLTWPDQPLEERLRFAMAVPAMTITRAGNKSPTLDEVRSFLRSRSIKIAA